MSRFSRVALVVSVLLFAAMLGWFPVQNFDLWMHLSAGRYIVQQGHLPYAHPFNFTAPLREWIDQEWLSQTLLYLLYRGVGVGGLVFLKSALAAAAVGLALWLAVRRGATLPVAWALAVVAALLVRPRLTVRPHLVTLTLLPLWALLLGGWPRRRWVPYVLVGSMVLWANLHAGFLAGLILLGLYWLEAVWRWRRAGPEARAEGAREVRSLGFLLAAGVAATLLNPYGWRLWKYPFTLVTMRVYMKYIEEWMRPDLSARFWLLYGYLAAGSALLLIRRRHLRPADGLIWVVFGVMALSARRHIAPLALVSAPVLAVALSGFRLVRRASGEDLRGGGGGRGWLAALGYGGAALVLVAVGLRAVWAAGPDPLRPGIRERFFPAGAARFLKKHSPELPRQLYNSYIWGGYLEWKLWEAQPPLPGKALGRPRGRPAQPSAGAEGQEPGSRPGWQMFIDGEAMVFGERIFEDWNRVYLLEPGWQQVLASYGVNSIIRDWGLEDPEPLLGTGEWVTVYWDDLAMVLVRRDATSAEFLTENDFSLTNPAWFLRRLPQDQATYEKALRQLDEAQRRFGPTGIGHHMRGALLYERGRYREALREFQADIALVPEEARSWSAAGDSWRKLGWEEEAIAAYRRALRRNPALIYARIHLALLYEGQGRRKRALRELRTVDSLTFDDPQLRQELRAKIAELER